MNFGILHVLSFVPTWSQCHLGATLAIAMLATVLLRRAVRSLVGLVDITLVEAAAALWENHRAKHWDAGDDDTDSHLGYGQNCTVRSAVGEVG